MITLRSRVECEETLSKPPNRSRYSRVLSRNWTHLAAPQSSKLGHDYIVSVQASVCFCTNLKQESFHRMDFLLPKKSAVSLLSHFWNTFFSEAEWLRMKMKLTINNSKCWPLKFNKQRLILMSYVAQLFTNSLGLCWIDLDINVVVEEIDNLNTKPILICKL